MYIIFLKQDSKCSERVIFRFLPKHRRERFEKNEI